VAGLWRGHIVTGILMALCGGGAAGTGTGLDGVSVSPASAVSIFSESDAVTATYNNGTGPFDYSWSMKEGSSVAIHIREPDAATTTFYCFDSGGEKDGTAICSVRDTATGLTRTSPDVRVILLTGTE
jgi:hypothetical protein